MVLVFILCDILLFFMFVQPKIGQQVSPFPSVMFTKLCVEKVASLSQLCLTCWLITKRETYMQIYLLICLLVNCNYTRYVRVQLMLEIFIWSTISNCLTEFRSKAFIFKCGVWRFKGTSHPIWPWILKDRWGQLIKRAYSSSLANWQPIRTTPWRMSLHFTGSTSISLISLQAVSIVSSW